MAIRCVIFDFDGTLVQSIAIKHESYFAAVADIAGGAEIFREVIRDFPSMTRYSGCALFVERARAAGLATPGAEALAARYTRACEDAIAACPKVPGAVAFLDWLGARGTDCFVVSGTPEAPMRDTVRRLGWHGRFRGVFGGPTGKPEHYAAILEAHGLMPEEVLSVGDSDDDRAAARSVGAHFVRVLGGAGPPGPDETSVASLTEIRELVTFA